MHSICVLLVLVLIFLTVYTCWSLYSATNSSGQVKQRKCSYFCDILSNRGFCTDIYLLIFQILIFIFLTVYYCLNFIMYIKWLSGLKSLYSLYFKIILPIIYKFSEVADNAILVIFHQPKSCRYVPIGQKSPILYIRNGCSKKNQPQKDLDSICHSQDEVKISGWLENFFSLGVKGLMESHGDTLRQDPSLLQDDPLFFMIFSHWIYGWQ
jgi:hypothetical protein